MRHCSPGGLTLGPVKASPEAQLRLLELADLDTELGRLEHRRQSLPENAELDRLTARSTEIGDSLVAADTGLGDLGREQSRAERDVDQVRARIDKDRQRLDAGKVSSARELESLQSEVDSLLRRQSDLEEIVLDLMEKRESIQGTRDTLASEQSVVAAETGAVTARRDAALKEITEQLTKVTDQRAGVAAGVPAELLTLYDRMRAAHGGIGAAALRGGRCEGCHLSLNTVDLNVIRQAAPDEVLRCEECRRILVRTPESGI
jgi:uncharacterized protein